MATGKNNRCWNCATPLDRPFGSRQPVCHGCGRDDCVVCPKCSEPLCAIGTPPAARGAALIEGLIGPVTTDRGPAASGNPGSRPFAAGGAVPVPLPDVPPFPVDVLPDVLARYAREAATALGCPVDYLALPMLALAGAAIGATRKIELKSTWRESATLYAAVVGHPGTTKSPALRSVAEPVEERQRELESRFRRDLAGYKEESGRREEAKKAAKRSPPSDGEEAQSVPSSKPRKPVLRRCVTNDATTEAVAVLLSDNPRGVALIRDELVAWTRSMDQYRGGRGADRQFYLSTWSGTPIRLDRKSNPDGLPVCIPMPFLTVVGGITPDMLPDLADEAGRQDGFCDRILFIYPDAAKPAEWSEVGVSPEAQQGWRDAMSHLFRLRFDRVDGKCEAFVLPLAPGAKPVWGRFFSEWSWKMVDGGPMAGTLSKLRGYCARIALILQLLREACGEADGGAVDEVSLEGAVSLTDYFLAHAERVRAAMAGGGPATRDQDAADGRLLDALGRWVDRSGGRWEGTASDLRQGLASLVDQAVFESPGWPADASALSRALRRLSAPVLEAARVTIGFSKARDRARTRLVTLVRASDASDASTPEATSRTTGGYGPDGFHPPEDSGPRPVRDRLSTSEVPGVTDGPRGVTSDSASDAEVVEWEELSGPSDASDASDG